MILMKMGDPSRVWLADDGWVYKRQAIHLAQNEIDAYRRMKPSGYVPQVFETDNPAMIRMEFVDFEPVRNVEIFMSHYLKVLDAMFQVRLRHGDLSEYSVLVRDDRPLLIDWAESRLWDDMRPDKRPEGDAHWLLKTMQKYSDGHTGQEHARR